MYPRPGIFYQLSAANTYNGSIWRQNFRLYMQAAEVHADKSDTWNDRRVTTSLQLANCQGLVMYTRGAAVASEQMLSAKMSVWNGPASILHPLGALCGLLQWCSARKLYCWRLRHSDSKAQATFASTNSRQYHQARPQVVRENR